MKSKIAHLFLVGIAVILTVVALPVAAHAQGASEQTKTNAQDKEVALNKPDDAKQRACQNHQKAITNILSRIADRGQKQINLFSIITQRTQNFYADKGKTLANYDALVADVATKKAAAQAVVDTLKSTSTTFDCSGDNPKGVADSFKDSLKKEIEALKTYKAAVNDLIVGVKSVQGTTSSQTGVQE